MKLMKFLLLLAALITLLPCACGETAVAGTWYGDTIILDGKPFRTEDPLLETWLEFDEDGTVQWKFGEKLYAGQWQAVPGTEELTLVIDGVSRKALAGTENLRFQPYDDDTTILYTRRKKDLAPFFRFTDAAGPEDFYGNWILDCYGSDGYLFPLSGMQEELLGGLVIDRDTVSFMFAFSGIVRPQYDTTFVFANGKLKLAPVEYPEIRIDEIRLAENGMLFVPIYSAGTAEDPLLRFYYSRE